MKTRLQFDVNETQLAELDELKGDAGAASRAEVVRDALRLYRWVIDKRRDGHTLKLYKNGKSETVHILSLETTI